MTERPAEHHVMHMSQAIQRKVRRNVPAQATLEGAGFLVHRPFPTGALDHVDPFLLLDEMGPSELAPNEAKGAPDHPHRGFETVTYMLAGRMRHQDSAGHAGEIGPGDVQWMTAGAGVVHSEMPEPGFLAAGGRMHGFQLWVNLPRQDKMAAPHYQEIASRKIPVAEAKGVRIHVIAGEALGQRAVINTRTPITYLHCRLEGGGRCELPLPPSYNACVYVFAGEASVAGELVSRGHLAILGDGEVVALDNPTEQAVELLLLAGEPLREPVVRYGPFVMNSPAEIKQAMLDYHSGKMGHIR